MEQQIRSAQYDGVTWLRVPRLALPTDQYVMAHPEDQVSFRAGEMSSEYVWVELAEVRG